MATGFLVFIIFATVVDKQTRHPNLTVNSIFFRYGPDKSQVTLPAPFAPLAIGLVSLKRACDVVTRLQAVVVDSFAAGPFTGGAMNPAR